MDPKDIIAQIEILNRKKQGLKVMAIDGPAASGKTTLASSLAKSIGCDVIHMDDFFLPKTLRTEERLNEAGGNVHYERFKEEVVDKLRHDQITYRRFDCSKMNFGEQVSIEPENWLIIEGSYSCHPYFGRYMDLSLFLHVPYERQLERIRERNGNQMFNKFIDTWIPMENKYFDTYEIINKADIVIEGSLLFQGEGI